MSSPQLTRRQLMGGVAGVAWANGETSRSHAADPERARFMARAIEMRKLAVERGDQPFGAVVVKDGRVVGEGASAVVTTPDPTAHGEVQAIRAAAGIDQFLHFPFFQVQNRHLFAGIA